MKFKFWILIALVISTFPSFAEDYLPIVPESMANAVCSMGGDLDMNSKIFYILDPRNYAKESTTLAYLVLKQYNAMQKLPDPDKINEIFVSDYFERTLKKCPSKFTVDERMHFQKEIRMTKIKYGI